MAWGSGALAPQLQAPAGSLSLLPSLLARLQSQTEQGRHISSHMTIMSARPSCMRMMLESALEDVLHIQDGKDFQGVQSMPEVGWKPSLRWCSDLVMAGVWKALGLRCCAGRRSASVGCSLAGSG